MQSSNASDLRSTTPPPQQLHHQPWLPPHWVGPMQYPNRAMMMQQQMMMYPHHYLPYNHPSFHYQFKHRDQQTTSSDEVKTVWIGDLLHWMDEAYLHTCFSHTGEVSSVKVIRNKQTGQSEGYGFVEFHSRATAESILQSYNGSPMPKAEQPFRLNWASFSSNDKRTEAAPDLSIFVGDLASDVTDSILQNTFAEKYPSVKGAKVVIDSNSGRSKGYGFVRFGDENERSRAMTEMNGIYCSTRPMRIGVATPKKATGYQQQYSSQALVLAGGHASNGALAQGSHADRGSNNTTIFVGGLDPDVSDEDLREPFSKCGEIVSVKIPTGRGCGFVQFATRKSAEDALESLNGTSIGKHQVRLSWGRSPGYKQARADGGNHWNGSSSYYRRQGYGGFQNQEQVMYAAAAAIPGTS